MAIVPQGLILEIQSRLAVKDLLRFRCVSKSWCSLIDDSYFIKLHLSHATNSSNLVEYDSFFDSPGNARRIKSPYGGYILGSCNGLLALLKGHEICLYNPSTRESRILPSVEMKIPSFVSWSLFVYGFGYDPISDDYKLIQMLQFYSHPYSCNVRIYSLRTNSWRRIEDLPSYFEPQMANVNGVLLNNALHWVASKKLENENQIVGFDLVTEKYRVLELPDPFSKWSFMYLKVIEGCLCLTEKRHQDSCWINFVFDIWMMKHYGLKQSWTKLISVTNSEFSDLRNKTVVGNVRIEDLQCLNVVESLVPVTRMQ